MSYYEDVYLKRINRFGTNIQERIQNSKIREFSIFLSKSPNKVRIFKDGEEFEGVLQNKTSSEKEVTSYLLTNIENDWDNGTIVNTQNLSNNLEQKWLIMHDDTYISIGYARYQVLELDMSIKWIDDGLTYNELVHFSGSGANLRDKAVTSKFVIQFDISLAYKPNKILSLVMKTHPHIKKGIRILIGDEVWRISGMDKTSVPGVSYVTLEEDYIDHTDDIVYADAPKLLKWEIQSNFGDTINLLLNTPTKVVFSLFYVEEERNEDIFIDIQNPNIASFENSLFTGKEIGETQCRVSLVESPEIYKDFLIKVSDTKEENYSIIGPDNLKVLGLAEYQIQVSDKDIAIKSKNNNFSIVSYQNNKLIIKGSNIGSDSIVIESDGAEILNKDIEIVSIWLEE